MPETVVMMHVQFKIIKYAFSGKKIKGKKKIIVQESCQMFLILYLYFIAFEYVLIAKEKPF